jgi:hypothetical protein
MIAVSLVALMACSSSKSSKAPPKLKVACVDQSMKGNDGTVLAAAMSCDVETAPFRRVVVQVPRDGRVALEERPSGEYGRAKINIVLEGVDYDATELEFQVLGKDAPVARQKVAIPGGVRFRGSATARDDGIEVQVDTCARCAVEIAGAPREGGRALIPYLDLPPIDGSASIPIAVVAPDGRRVESHVSAGVDDAALQRLAAQLDAVAKTPLPWAAERQPGPGRPILVAGDTKLTAANGLTRLRDAEIVVVRRYKERSESCPFAYQDSDGNYTFGVRFHYSAELTAYEARTGKKLADKKFRGKPPGPCPRKVTSDIGHVVVLGDKPDENEITAWLATL